MKKHAPSGAAAPPIAETPRQAESGNYLLRLYVTGVTPASARAVVNARRICEQYLKGRYRLEILEIADNIAAVARDQIIAAPTLVKLAPGPLRRFIGDLSNTDRILAGLDVDKAKGAALPPD